MNQIEDVASPCISRQFRRDFEQLRSKTKLYRLKTAQATSRFDPFLLV